ncbi:hypothetical protein [Pseudarcicella hirudinis]|nr:hypothetical protein [Pseudarcicella hirudinis]
MKHTSVLSVIALFAVVMVASVFCQNGNQTFLPKAHSPLGRLEKLAEGKAGSGSLSEKEMSVSLSGSVKVSVVSIADLIN